MIVVDSSVWINHFRNIQSRQVSIFETATPDSIVAGDVIVLEVLRGVENERQADAIARKFALYGVTPMLNPELAIDGARNYRRLRSLGITVAKLADLIIATFCIALGHELLHQDHDYDHFERHLGLQIVRD